MADSISQMGDWDFVAFFLPCHFNELSSGILSYTILAIIYKFTVYTSVKNGLGIFYQNLVNRRIL